MKSLINEKNELKIKKDYVLALIDIRFDLLP